MVIFTAHIFRINSFYDFLDRVIMIDNFAILTEVRYLPLWSHSHSVFKTMFQTPHDKTKLQTRDNANSKDNANSL